ncbi:leucyl aminopeptidase [Buchnera aphidicola]|uniref:Probable cytosol aminopeptidase n=1 Tax=Buchnera aphidicola subsp. Acyrthosiphon pisum (strain Tuc7) TaxID=561501 RepID=AMPA_BUCAT|nr:leucyl aminopeptidase [Buchnera aphidicola]B8D7Q4.1 RecName: Full=Probable cytosol aminopeptidase; AltName: Full=Leucine aminopeptidase; Short=LAP; AltName: Full=Leucyl aminopeptidase [Buchnera aphidicola str. Tuc7 (Acyrthosiphon pisum)]ACL30169.1 aminopeptidase A/I [Buchnera aphidicola str. Tuc7 (Acyrthosiphon pisum)]ADP66186.1 leucyl aminopeptidase [Buchnera aphidicola str. LL01 (Acyrthosiphon pisum)]ADP66758.1 leucyl aminopeptidase [Buchnera aphidicola str. TLW03 (Acyrthosiphon pisum)]
MNFFIKSCFLDKEKTDCIVVSVFELSELSDSAIYLDKCSNGHITSLIKLGDIQGKIGDTLMLYKVPKILSKRILLVGCGKKDEINIIRFKKILKNTIHAIKKKSIKNIVYSFSNINIDNIYWMIRRMVLSLKESLYETIKINNTNIKNTNIHSITLNIIKKNDLFIAKTALKHALAIDHAITSTKNLSNLPPNICNPLYLSYKAQELSKKYENNIVVEIIDIKKMKELGMNAYIAVGNGSKNKPFMSVIKYSGNNIVNKKIIAFVGKGLTFDSGGISIKPALHMHEMKYDMCGAAAVYGTLIMAAELQLPLTVIGILSGCENMVGSHSFRPGDVLTTMSGQTVEILNTDAEGRLVLCDSLTYLERFSPDIVIDVATLTGACVTALGESVSGLFSNNEELSNQLLHASQETDDKIWSLPLFSEYHKELNSNIADFSNIGRGKAGAITAACFLSKFTKKYNWAHLDIAGTAWKSGKKSGATGRPVELLCQFLLNQSNYIYN